MEPTVPKQPENQPIPDKQSAEQLELIGAVDTYTTVLGAVVELMEAARRAAARSVNAIMTATYWEIGRRIIELEQRGESRAEYGKQIIERLAKDLSDRFGRGFQKSNLFQMRAFYLAYPHQGQSFSPETLAPEIFQTLSGKFPLPWSHYVKLLTVKAPGARTFTKQKPYVAGGPCANLASRLTPNTTNVPYSPATKQPC
nr:DUF1016 N-terminal domain-containing protein [Leptolyngbya sp. FACHB-321]